MPVDPHASVRISAFKWVPPFAKGHVRDLRVRWALEEAGIPYAVRKLDAAAERPADYFEEQPFGQVPSYRDDTVSLFESGAIVLHVGRNSEALLPADPAAQARATAWLIAALNSVEPFVMQLATIDIFLRRRGMGETAPAGGGRDDRQSGCRGCPMPSATNLISMVMHSPPAT